MNYYRADNAGRPVAGLRFEVYAIVAGTACGVYATEDPKQIEALEKLAADKTSSVTSITQAEYEDYQKKKAPSPKPWSPSSVAIPQIKAEPIKGSGNVQVAATTEAKEEPPIEITKTVESVDAALVVAPVKTADGQAEPMPVPPPTDGRTLLRKAKRQKA